MMCHRGTRHLEWTICPLEASSQIGNLIFRKVVKGQNDHLPESQKSGYGRSEFDRQMPVAGLSYTITSRELVLQAPHPTASTAGPLRALPLTPRLKGMIL